MKMGPPPTCHHVSVIKRNPFYKGPDNAKAELTAVTQKTRVFGGVKTRSLRFHMTIGDGHFGYTTNKINKRKLNLRCMHRARGCKAVATIATNKIVTVSVLSQAMKKNWRFCPSNATSQLTNNSSWGEITLNGDHICI